ncbi:MAG TPA: hypothetical protein VHX87_04815 [Galbitalea sp.]|jgi:hypothetical protein|nr:hypothetical protein [Galbitalea sp.]
MSAPPDGNGVDARANPHNERLRPRKRPWLIAAAALLVVAVIAAVIANPFGAGEPARPAAVRASNPTSLYTVTRQDLSAQTQVPATLGYADTFSVVNQAPGIVTAVPAVGQVVREGHVLYRVSGAPVVLLKGSTPAYRTITWGASGADVAELNADLVALGYVTRAEIRTGAAGFTYWSAVGVRRLQTALGDTQTGRLMLGQVVFAPTALRVTEVFAALGTVAGPGEPVVSATSTIRNVSISLEASEQSEVAVGDKVTITLPNNRTTPGVISSVGTVAIAPAAGSSDDSPTVTVLVTPNDSAATGTWDDAPVNVTITTGSVSNVLAVPVDALLAETGGTYAVEVAGANGARHLVPVTLGLFDDADGMVQVTGSKVAAGQRVVVPKL